MSCQYLFCQSSLLCAGLCFKPVPLQDSIVLIEGRNGPVQRVCKVVANVSYFFHTEICKSQDVLYDNEMEVIS